MLTRQVGELERLRLATLHQDRDLVEEVRRAILAPGRRLSRPGSPHAAPLTSVRRESADEDAEVDPEDEGHGLPSLQRLSPVLGSAEFVVCLLQRSAYRVICMLPSLGDGDELLGWRVDGIEGWPGSRDATPDSLAVHQSPHLGSIPLGGRVAWTDSEGSRAHVRCTSSDRAARLRVMVP